MLGNKLRSFASQQSVIMGKQDSRLKLLSSQYKSYQESRNQSDTEIFKDKRVLDIGCNYGATALQIAAFYAPDSVLGVDIDPQMVKSAT